MKKIIVLIFILLLPSFLIASCGFFKNPEKEARESYQRFLTSIVDKNWNESWNLMAQESQIQYDKFIFQPFKTSIASVPYDKKKVKLSKLDVSIAQIENMTPQEFFAFQMNGSELSKMILKALEPEKKITDVRIGDDGKSATLGFDGGTKKVRMRLEDGIWRVVTFPPGDLK